MHDLTASSLLRTLRWQDAVDVFLLTLLFSWAYRRLRKTVAIQVALGLLTLVAVSWLANQIGLILTSYLLSAVSAVATLLVVVVFQHEIRHGLSRVNPLRWLGRHREHAGAFDARNTVARAAFSLAERKKGALIVISRGDALAAHITDGVALDARLSIPLIEAVFTSTSPLHDGAILISDERVLRASVVLPLATGSDDTSHGTRHRAARGLAQVTDALVVCVSEEHGTVALAFGDRLETVESEDQLRATLRRLWTLNLHRDPSHRQGFSLRSLLIHVALFVSVAGAWSVLALDRSHVMAKVAPLEIRGIADGLTFDPLRYTSVVLDLRGSRRELARLPASAVQAYVDLSRTSPGLHTFRVQTELPPGIEVANATPASVDLRIRARAVPGQAEPVQPKAISEAPDSGRRTTTPSHR
jgi:diadenylate cyclase